MNHEDFIAMLIVAWCVLVGIGLLSGIVRWLRAAFVKNNQLKADIAISPDLTERDRP